MEFMSPRAVWSVVLVLCLLWIVGGFGYALSVGRGYALPLLLSVPAVILARIAWQRVRRA